MIYSTARRSAPETPPDPGSAPGMPPKLVPADRVVIQRPPRPGLTVSRPGGKLEQIESTVLSFRGARMARVGNS